MLASWKKSEKAASTLARCSRSMPPRTASSSSRSPVSRARLERTRTRSTRPRNACPSWSTRTFPSRSPSRRTLARRAASDRSGIGTGCPLREQRRDRGVGLAGGLFDRKTPEAVRVGEDLHVEVAVPAGQRERLYELAGVREAFAGEQSVGSALVGPIGDVHARDPVGGAPDEVPDGRVVPH